MVFFTFLFGLAIGSFLNVVIDRVPAGKSIGGRSVCDGCGRQLSWRENIPLLSLFWQKGLSRCCGQKLSYQYPLVELSCALLFLLTYYFFHFTDPLLFVILPGLLALLVIDLKLMLLPDVIVYPLIALGFLRLLLTNLGNLSYLTLTLGGSLIIAGFFLLIIYLTKGRGMGGGDIKLGFLVGILSGWPQLLTTLYLSFVMGGLVAAFLLITRRKHLGQHIPFGPFLILAVFAVLFLPELSSKLLNGVIY